MTEPEFDEAFWDQRYGSAERLWSGNPNPLLLREVVGLTPGTALDAGCGEGADALWLAGEGWTVTATDLSRVALQRAAEHAAQQGLTVEWVHADITAWQPPRQFDLVSAQYLHLPEPQRNAALATLATAVAPGGTLLVAAHSASDLHTSAGRPHRPDLFYDGAQIRAALDTAKWQVLTDEEVPRAVTDPQGRQITVSDVVVKARRSA